MNFSWNFTLSFIFQVNIQGLSSMKRLNSLKESEGGRFNKLELF